MLLTQRQIKNFWKKVNKAGPTVSHLTTPCWIWTGAKDTRGYGHQNINSKLVRASRLSYLIHNNYLASDLFVLHACDTPLCVNPSHLRQGTCQDNSNDMKARGRQNPRDNKGIANPRSCLTDKDVIEIRILHNQGLNNKQIARQFNVTHQMISLILLGKAWQHI